MMTSSAALLHSISTIAAFLIAAIGEAALLVVATALCLALFPAVSASARSRIWMVVFAASMLLPLLAIPNRVAGISSQAYSSLQVSSWWAVGLLSLWAVLFVYRGAQFVRSALHLRRVTGRATPIAADADVSGQFNAESGRRRVQLCSSKDIDIPSVVGFLHPRILLPAEMLEEISPLDLRQIVLHEVEHLRRKDDWTNLLQKAGLVLFPINPVLFWIERSICVERELACDDGVLRVTGARKAYASCLANLAEHSLLRRGMTLALGAWQRQSELTRRVLRILRAPQQQMDSRRAMLSRFAAIAFVIGSSVTLARMPQLVTFGADAPSTDTAVLSSATESARSFRTMTAPHMTLASAVMPGRTQPFATKMKRSPSRRKVYRSIPVLKHRSQPWMMLTEWHEVRSTPRLTLAVSENSPFTYAAIPVRDGWLVVQL